MKTRNAILLLLGIGLLGCTSKAVAQSTHPNINSIDENDMLYADLNNDGRVEHVILYSVGDGSVPSRNKNEELITVVDDTGREIYRAKAGNTDPYQKHAEHRVLRDIDDDGYIELVLSRNSFENQSYGTPYTIYRWKNGAFHSYLRVGGCLDLADVKSFTKCSDGIYRITDRPNDKSSLNGLFHLRQVKGQLLGDIVIDQYDPNSTTGRKAIPGLRPGDTITHNSGKLIYIYRTAIVEPCKGGLRVIGYKNFYSDLN